MDSPGEDPAEYAILAELLHRIEYPPAKVLQTLVVTIELVRDRALRLCLLTERLHHFV